MSGLIATASSKEIIMPSEIQEYNDAGIFDIPNKAFSLSTKWKRCLKFVRPPNQFDMKDPNWKPL